MERTVVELYEGYFSLIVTLTLSLTCVFYLVSSVGNQNTNLSKLTKLSISDNTLAMAIHARHRANSKDIYGTF
jgi:hypothetical protein